MRKIPRRDVKRIYSDIRNFPLSMPKSLAYQLLLVHKAMDDDEKFGPLQTDKVRLTNLQAAIYSALSRVAGEPQVPDNQDPFQQSQDVPPTGVVVPGHNSGGDGTSGQDP